MNEQEQARDYGTCPNCEELEKKIDGLKEELSHVTALLELEDES